MRNYTETCKDICGNNLVYNLCIPFAVKKFGFCCAFFKRILSCERGISKTWFLDSYSPCHLSFGI